MGSCTAGGAYVPAMSDETIIVTGTGTIFLGGPPLVKAATGEEVTAEDLGGADVHTRLSGVADYFADDDAHASQLARTIVVDAEHRRRRCPPTCSRPKPPAYDPAEIYGIIPRDVRQPYDVREVHRANRGRLALRRVQGTLRADAGHAGSPGSTASSWASSRTMACCSRSRPSRPRISSSCATCAGSRSIFLQNITGFIVGRQYERAGIAKDGAKMVHAVANSVVPKFTVIIGGSFGAGNYGMCGRAYDPRFLWMWPNARISVMGAEQAAGVLTTVKRDQMAREGRTLTEAEEARRSGEPILEKYEREGSPYYSTARLWDDGVIDPATSETLGLALVGGLQRADPRRPLRRLQDVSRGVHSPAWSARDGPVEHLTLNRPEVRNAFNEQMIAELSAWAIAAARRRSPGCGWPSCAAPVRRSARAADLTWMARTVGRIRASRTSATPRPSRGCSTRSTRCRCR